MVNGMTRRFRWAGVLILAAFNTPAVAAPCDPEENTWIPSRYYPPGQTVFHQGDWYQSSHEQYGYQHRRTTEFSRLVPSAGRSLDISFVWAYLDITRSFVSS